MGCFDSFYTSDGREVQLKAGPCCLYRYDIGEHCEDYEDGVYHALDGDVVIIRRSEVVFVGDENKLLLSDTSGLAHFDKWGSPYTEGEE
jgi:hypothetical protein